MGIPILCVVGALLIYTFANVRFGKVIYDLFYTTNGIMGTPIKVCAQYIVVFIIFGAFLERTGISSFFIDLANSVAGFHLRRSRQGGCYLLRPVRHGVRLLRGQHR